MTISISEAHSALVDQLTSQGKNQSLFENEIRRLAVPMAKVFDHQGQAGACGFEAAAVSLPKRSGEAAVATAFKNLYPVNKDVVLKAGGKPAAGIKGLRVAVLFSGGPAAGGHNVLVGLKKALGKDNQLLGIKSGPKGLLEGQLFEISEDALTKVVNTGGFDFLGSDRTKIKTDEQFAQVKKTCRDHRLDALVVVGGDDSNTNAAMLAEFLYSQIHDDGRGVQVIGVPKTIDGDLQVGTLLPISFGFDTATKIYAEMVGNILQDTPSSRKYWHFIKLMGRSASHVALEVALQTRPAVALISEEVEARAMSLAQVVDIICRAVVQRAAKGINHGVVLIPEGLIEFIPEMKTLIAELNEVMAQHKKALDNFALLKEKKDFIYGKITPVAAKLMGSLPDEFEDMLLLDRDSHGNLQVSQIPTEKLLIEMTKNRLKEMRTEPELFFGEGKINLNAEERERFVKSKFSSNNHFFGYEGRCGAPSRFDSCFTYNLGLAAGSVIINGKTGYMVTVTAFQSGGEAYAVPLTGLINSERRHGKDELVIEKALVKIDSPAFKFFEANRNHWAQEDCFASPGPRQFWGPTANQIPILVALNQGYESLNFNLG